MIKCDLLQIERTNNRTYEVVQHIYDNNNKNIPHKLPEDYVRFSLYGRGRVDITITNRNQP